MNQRIGYCMTSHRHAAPESANQLCRACGAVSSLGLPILALALASIVALSLLGLKIVLFGKWRHLYLAWNLFLAWVPLLCSWKVWHTVGGRQSRSVELCAVISLWFLFFPNAPYMVTDLMHLGATRGGHYWADLVLIALFAVIGLVAGFVSLYLMHAAVRRQAGKLMGWGFVAVMAGLSGLGVYLGRFLRWNSWDLLFNPLSFVKDVALHFTNAANHPLAFAFPVLFGAFMFAAYGMLYGLTFLPRETTGLSPARVGMS